ncbi:putative toxin-antitoxin system toxin component, PIN family [Prevotella sp.]|uniref:putative toxin-antitoxin system toxin component, PIN family n=1 Tax=Prevotella sp. TaxID=59823 RepID=UPI00402982AB
MKRIVLDTNCLLMCLPKISPYRSIWDDFLKGTITLCVSNEIIEEYLEILTKKTTYEIACNIISVLLSKQNVEFITPYYKLHLIESDEDDNKFVDCAFSAGASCIVSNDAHFNILKSISFPHIIVLNISEFLDHLNSALS